MKIKIRLNINKLKLLYIIILCLNIFSHYFNVKINNVSNIINNLSSTIIDNESLSLNELLYSKKNNIKTSMLTNYNPKSINIIDLSNPNNVISGWFSISGDFNNIVSNKEEFNNIIQNNAVKDDLSIRKNYNKQKDKDIIINDKYIFNFKSRGDIIYYTTNNSDTNILHTIYPYKTKKVLYNNYYSDLIDEKKLDSYLLKYIKDYNLYKNNNQIMNNIKNSLINCFIIYEKNNLSSNENNLNSAKNNNTKEWTICSSNLIDINNWICSLQVYLNQIDMEYDCTYNNSNFNNNNSNNLNNNFNRFIKYKTTIIPVIPFEENQCNLNWNYEKQGHDWECICKDGLYQSPINIETKNVVKSAYKPIILVNTYIDYIDECEDKDSIQNNQQMALNINNPCLNTNTIVYNNNYLKMSSSKIGYGKIIDLNGATYKAVDIIFHSPAEHLIDGKRFDLEMQVIYEVDNSIYNIKYKKSVLSFLFTKKAGNYNKFFKMFNFFDLPNKEERIKYVKQSLNLNDLFVNEDYYIYPDINNDFNNTINIERNKINDDIEKDIVDNKIYNNINSSNNNNQTSSKKELNNISFYYYNGSLSYPPCSEEVIYYIAKKPIELSITIINMFYEAIGSEVNNISNIVDNNESSENIKDNYIISSIRDIQNLNNRKVYFYDSSIYNI